MPHFFTHLYCAEAVKGKLKLDGFDRELFLVGNVLPDLDLLNDTNLHGQSDAFYKHLLDVSPAYAALGAGMINHELIDDEYHAYIFEKEEVVKKRVKNGEPVHNISEFIIDYFLITHNCIKKDILKEINVDFDDIASCLGQFFVIDEQEVGGLLKNYYKIMNETNFSTLEDVEESFNKQFPKTQAKISNCFHDVEPLFRDCLSNLGPVIESTSITLCSKVEKYKKEAAF